MECSVVIEPTSNSRHYGGGVAQFDIAQKSNSKVAIVRCPCSRLSLLRTWEKHLTLAAVQLRDTSVSWQLQEYKLSIRFFN